MSNYEELLNAVTANPEDDAPRLAFASHIRSHEPERARFIELQIEWARECRSRYPRRARLTGVHIDAEWRPLLERYKAEWTRPIGKYTTNWTFDRGFITGVSIEANVFLEYGEWLFTNAPIRVVHFFVMEGEFPSKALAESPLLARLDSIDLPRNDVSTSDVEILAQSPHLPRLLQLYCPQYAKVIGSRAYESLASSPLTRKLLGVGFSEVDFPGERLEETGNFDFWGYPEYEWTDLAPEGKALEAKYGYIPWLHPRENSVDAYDAAYFVSKGVLPVKTPGEPVT